MTARAPVCFARVVAQGSYVRRRGLGAVVATSALAIVAAAPAAVAAAAPATAPAAARQPAAGSHACRAIPRSGTNDDVAILGPDAAVWFGDRRGNRIVRLDAEGKQKPFVPGSGATSGLSGLAFGADGALWYTKASSNRIGRIAAHGVPALEFEAPESNSNPEGLLADRAGRLWFYSRPRNYVGLLRTNATVQVHRGPVALSTGFAPRAMTVGADGNLWITDRGHNAVYRFDVERRRYTRFDLATPAANPGAITLGRDGNVWFAMNAVAKIGRISPAGEIVEFDVPQLRGVELRGLAATPDGSIWVASRGPSLARVLPDTTVRTIPCADGLGTAFLGPDGAPWFLGDERIWRVDLASH